MRATIRHMRVHLPNPLTIKNPNSLAGCAPDVWSQFRPTLADALRDPMQPYWDMLAEKEKANDA